MVRGRSVSAMIAASLFAACRTTETQRTLKDISQAGNLEKRDVSKCYRLIHRELGLKMPVVDSIQCIARISSRLEIPEKIKRRATEILKLCQECENSAGKEPMGLAAAALYMSCIENAHFGHFDVSYQVVHMGHRFLMLCLSNTKLKKMRF